MGHTNSLILAATLICLHWQRRMGADERHDTTTDEYHSSTGGSTAREHPRNDTVEV